MLYNKNTSPNLKTVNRPDKDEHISDKDEIKNYIYENEQDLDSELDLQEKMTRN